LRFREHLDCCHEAIADARAAWSQRPAIEGDEQQVGQRNDRARVGLEWAAQELKSTEHMMSGSAELLRQVNRLLARRYGTPHLGNKRHPISELVFIILSARTRGVEHEAFYRKLRRAFPTWEAVRDAPTRGIERVIHDAGLSRIKARQIKAILRRITHDFGSLSGRGLRSLSPEKLEGYLASLPGVGLKTARCVMLYSFDIEVFPVDTHCMRLFQNLGLVAGPMRFEKAQDPLQAMVPAAIRYSLHVNTVAHGRATCTAAPRCAECVIQRLCLAPCREADDGSGSKRT
jgi:endonuclease III